MNLTALYDIATKDNIDIFSFDMHKCESISLNDNGNYFIAIDPFKLISIADEKVKVAHELGHCETGAFYNEYSRLDVRQKHEHRADKWAIKKLVPKDELIEAFKTCTNRWELSEYFEVTEDFMQKALDYYSLKNI